MTSKPHYRDESVTVYHGDCLDVLADLDDESIDSAVTDPPYGLDFMGKHWDTGAVAFDIAVWGHVLRVLKPGGHLLAFGGTRTWHRLAAAIEDAGFELRDSIAWLYGNGFPKGTVSLKPAFEPIVVARKPFRGSARQNVKDHGVGVLDIDGCRVQETGGRWPTNVVLDDQAAAELDQETTHLKPGGAITKGSKGAGPRANEVYGTDDRPRGEWQPYGDSGGASRFFPTFRYQSKAPASERPRVGDTSHPTVKPLALMQWLVRLVTPSGGSVLDPFVGSGTTVEAALAEGASCIAIEREADYLPLIEARISRASKSGAA